MKKNLLYYSILFMAANVFLCSSALIASKEAYLQKKQHAPARKQKVISPQPQPQTVAKPSIIQTNIPLSFFRVTDQGIYIDLPLRSHEKQLVIEASGDLFLNKLTTDGDLVIRTTGTIHLHDDVQIGGTTTIKGQEIIVYSEFVADGRTRLLTDKAILIKGSVSSKNIVELISKDTITVTGAIDAAEGVLGIAGGLLEHKGTLASDREVVFKVKSYIQTGSIVTLLKTSIFTEEDLVLAKSATIGARQLFLKSLRRNLSILGDAYSEEGIQLLASERIVIAGMVTAEAAISAVGKDCTITGAVIAVKGIILAFEKEWVLEGLCKALGSGLQAKVGQFMNKGSIETSGTSLSIETGKNYGTILTRGHFTLKVLTYNSFQGSLTFTTGVHQIDCVKDYIDQGELFVATLLLAQAGHLKFYEGHRSRIKDALLSSTINITVAEGASINLFGARVFLQLSSDGSVTFRGSAAHDSLAQFPYEKLIAQLRKNAQSYPNSFFNSSHISTHVECKAEVDHLSKTHQYRELARGSGIAIAVQGDVKYAGSAKLDAGAFSVVAQGNFDAERAKAQAGYFTGDSVSVQSAQMVLDKASIKGYFDIVLHATSQALSMKSVDMSAGMSTVLRGLSIDIEKSNLESIHGQMLLDAQTSAVLKKTALQSMQDTVVRGKSVIAQEVRVVTEASAAIIAQQALELYEVALTSQRNIVAGTDITAQKLSLAGDTDINAHNSLSIRGLASTGNVVTSSGGTTTFEDTVDVKGMQSRAKKLVLDADVKGEGALQFAADTIKHNKSLEGEAIYVEAENFDDRDSSSAIARKEIILKVEKGKGCNGRLQGNTVVISMDDFQLTNLKNVIAYLTQLHINKDVLIDKDLILKNSLHLWSNSLISKAQVDVHGDFYVQTSTDILLGGGMNLKGTGSFIGANVSTDRAKLAAENLYFQAKQGDVSLYQSILKAVMDVKIIAEKESIKKLGTAITAGGAVALRAAKDIEARSQVLPGTAVKNKTEDSVVEDSIHAGNIALTAGQNLKMGAVTHEARENISYHAGANILDDTVAPVSTQVIQDQESRTNNKKVTHKSSRHKAGNTLSSYAAGDQHLVAPEMKGKQVLIKAGGKVTAYEAQDITESRFEAEHDGGFFGEEWQKKRYTFSALSKGLKIKATERVQIEGGDEVSLTNVSIQAPRIALTSVASTVKILLGHNHSYESSSEKSSNLLWQKQRSHVEEHKTFSASAFDGVLEIKSKQVLVETIKGQTLALMRQIEEQGISAVYNALEEVHFVDTKSSQGPSAALAVVVVVAVSICTAGAGASLGAAAAGGLGVTGTAATVVTGMTAAAFTSLCSQVTLALLANEGNVIKALESVCSTRTLENLGVAMITGGVTAGLSDLLNVPTASQATSAIDHIERQAIQSTISTTAAIAQGKKKPEEALLQGLKGAAAGALGAIAASEIGHAYLHHDIDFIGHKFFHALVGGATGALMGEKPLEGAAAGAFGAVTAEMVGELVLMNCHKIAGDVADQLKEKNIQLSPENIQNAVREELSAKTDIIKLLTSGIALLAGQDVSIATFTASTALDNNLSTMAQEITELDLYDILKAQGAPIIATKLPSEADQIKQQAEADASVFPYDKLTAEEKAAYNEGVKKTDSIETDGLFNEAVETVATGGLRQAPKLIMNVAKNKVKKTVKDAAVEKGKKVLAEPDAANRAQFLEYQKELARQEVQKPIDGTGAIKNNKVLDRLETEHPLPREGFRKDVGDGHTFPDGEHVEIHTYSHVDKPGVILEQKLKEPEFKLKNGAGEWSKDRLSPWVSSDTKK